MYHYIDGDNRAQDWSESYARFAAAPTGNHFRLDFTVFLMKWTFIAGLCFLAGFVIVCLQWIQAFLQGLT